MSILSRALGLAPAQSATERKVADASNLTWSEIMGPGGASKTGAAVNLSTVLRIATAWACCRVVAEDIGKLPFRLYQREGERKRVARDHPIHKLISGQPNEWQTSQDWRQMMTLHASLTHGGYSWINRSSNGVVVELIPLLNVTPKQGRAWDLTFEVRDGKGKIATLKQSEVFRIQGLSWDGYTGLEMLQHGREAFGLAIATEESQARLHANGTRPGGVVTTSNTLTDDQVTRIRKQLEPHLGLQNSFKTLLLDNGLEFKGWTMSGVDAQHLETRKFQIEEVCRFFRVFPAMIGHSDKASTFASADAFFRAHVGHTLMPWIERWQAAVSRDLLQLGERRNGYFAKLDPRGLLRGDDAARAEFYKSGVIDGWMTRNEVRDLEDLDPIDGLDDPLTPTNMTTDPAGGAAGGGPAKGQDGGAAPADEDPEEGE